MYSGLRPGKTRKPWGFLGHDVPRHVFEYWLDMLYATCMSGSGTCTRNLIEFHSYRPLTADAQARF
jgi:hypothetical protein